MSQEEEEKEATGEATGEEPRPADAEATEAAPVERPAQEHAPAGGGEPERAGTGPPERRRRRFGRRKVCGFCVEHVRAIDYKEPVKIRRYLSDRGRIEPRRKTGTCAKHQRWLAIALKRARHLALLPYTPEHIRTTGAFAARR